MKSLNSLQELFVDELRDVHNAETQITRALPKLVKAASNPKLRKAFESHLAITKEHVKRLETIMDSQGIAGRGKKCKGMEGLLAEGADVLESGASAEVLDAALIAAAQRVEHYEIAAYGTLSCFALHLGLQDASKLLEKTLREEKDADLTLTDIAESFVNDGAASRASA